MDHRIATNGSILTFFAAFKRRESDLSNDGKMDNFEAIHGKLESNLKIIQNYNEICTLDVLYCLGSMWERNSARKHDVYFC